MLLFIYESWHFCFLKEPSYQKIDTVNFMNEAKAQEMIKSSFSESAWLNYDDCSEELKHEIQTKVFADAEKYRTLLEQNEVNLVVGWTSDTLTAIPNDPDKLEAILEAVAECIKNGHGAYLRFNK